MLLLGNVLNNVVILCVCVVCVIKE